MTRGGALARLFGGRMRLRLGRLLLLSRSAGSAAAPVAPAGRRPSTACSEAGSEAAAEMGASRLRHRAQTPNMPQEMLVNDLVHPPGRWT